MSNLHPVDTAIEKGIKEGVFPGASLLVGKENKILWNKVYGSAQIDPKKRSVEPPTLFDIASLTKPMAIATLFMLVLQEKKCFLDDPLKKYFPETTQQGITLQHLLNHTSGLPAWRPYYEEMLALAPGWAAEDKGKNWLVEEILAEPQEAPVGKKTVYSDLGYILLGAILEKIYGKSLDLLFRQKIAEPLNLKKTFFNPLGHHRKPVDGNPDHFAATEKCPWRQKILCGEVMDDHAWLMGGIAGHAGLFSTAEEVQKWIAELQKARHSRSKLISRETFNRFTVIPDGRDMNVPYFTFGFDTPSAHASCGQYFSPNSIGHLGYTGCSFWWDMDKDIYAILLTNRVHPSRENDRIRVFRPKIHNTIIESLNLT
ncbi:MAG: beta-lactamase family protein [Deltaproteobacteria bacterium]|nr:beta-lactamase family protein [Deltaproteobacteria bacterium]